jgi:hypothetical protein
VQGFPSLLHATPAPALSSGGQLVPLQASATSHSPATGRQVGAGLEAVSKSQVPVVHLFTVHTLLSSQTAHAAPFLPHWPGVSLGRVTQVAPFRHPVQQVRVWPAGSRLQMPGLP